MMERCWVQGDRSRVILLRTIVCTWNRFHHDSMRAGWISRKIGWIFRNVILISIEGGKNGQDRVTVRLCRGTRKACRSARRGEGCVVPPWSHASRCHPSRASTCADPGGRRWLADLQAARDLPSHRLPSGFIRVGVDGVAFLKRIRDGACDRGHPNRHPDSVLKVRSNESTRAGAWHSGHPLQVFPCSIDCCKPASPWADRRGRRADPLVSWFPEMAPSRCPRMHRTVERKSIGRLLVR